ncbi:MAG: siderophore-interacting protein [Pseudomonadota bacterium]
MLRKIAKFIFDGRFGRASVEAVNRLTPHMIRVTLKSDLVTNFSESCPGAHLKLIVPAADQSPYDFAEFIDAGNFKKEMRTYTIRHIAPDAGTIDVDIAVHGDLGRVGPWAQRAEVGDEIVISRCGSPKLITAGVKRIIAAADLTGFPALAAGLETLGPGVKVEAFVEIPGKDDQQPLNAPAGVDINWIIKADPYAPSTELIDVIKAAPSPDGDTSIFVACEFSTVAELRRYFRHELKTEKSMRYISSYWKSGATEEEHKIAKAAAA